MRGVSARQAAADSAAARDACRRAAPPRPFSQRRSSGAHHGQPQDEARHQPGAALDVALRAAQHQQQAVRRERAVDGEAQQLQAALVQGLRDPQALQGREGRAGGGAGSWVGGRLEGEAATLLAAVHVTAALPGATLLTAAKRKFARIPQDRDLASLRT